MILNVSGYEVLIDDEDYALVSQYNWFIHKRKGEVRAKGTLKGIKSLKQVFMSRLVMGVTDPKIFVDHIFHNTLDNRKENLRVCTNSQNCMNRKPFKNKVGYKGVYYYPNYINKWEAKITKNGKTLCIGYFKTEEEAHHAYCEKAKELFGEFAYLN